MIRLAQGVKPKVSYYLMIKFELTEMCICTLDIRERDVCSDKEELWKLTWSQKETSRTREIAE